MPKVEVVRPFNEHHNGGMVHPPEIILVTDTRRSELIRLGLARDPVQAVRTAPTPENKMMPAPENKASPAPTPDPVKRRPGRPPGTKSGAR